MARSAGDRASCSVITSVPSLRTTVTDLGTWFPVRRRSKAIAARAICRAMVGWVGPVRFVTAGYHLHSPPRGKKKAAGAEPSGGSTTRAYSLTGRPAYRDALHIVCLRNLL